MRMLRVIAAGALALALTACDADDDATTDETTTEEDAADDPASDDAGDEGGAGEPRVEIVDNDYEPADLEVAVGDTVVWENTGGANHTVTFDDEDSGDLASGDTFERTFEEAGELDYVCTIHPQMEGTVTVAE